MSFSSLDHYEYSEYDWEGVVFRRHIRPTKYWEEYDPVIGEWLPLTDRQQQNCENRFLAWLEEGYYA